MIRLTIEPGLPVAGSADVEPLSSILDLGEQLQKRTPFEWRITVEMGPDHADTSSTIIATPEVDQ